MKSRLLICSILFLFLNSCTKYAKHVENKVQILVSDSLSLASLDPKSTEILHDLIDIVETKEEVKNDSIPQAHIFHPTIYRLDDLKPLPFEIKIQSFSGDKNNPTVLKKKISGIFEEENLKENLKNFKLYFTNFNSQQSTELNMAKFLNIKSKKDSLIFVDLNVDSAWVNYGNRKYIYLHDMESVKEKMKIILQNKSNTSFTIIMGMPLYKSQVQSIIIDTEIKTDLEKQRPIKAQRKKETKQTKSIRFKVNISVDKETSEIIQSPNHQSNQREWSGKNRTLNEIKNNEISGKEAKANQ